MKQINSYKFRIYPTSEQENQLFKTIGCARKTYNLLLETYNQNYESYKNGTITEDEYKQNKKKLNPSVFKKDEEYAYLKEIDGTALKYAQKHLDKAFNSFYNGRTNKPVFKSKNNDKWSYSTCRGSRKAKNLRLEKGGKLVLPKVPGKIKTVVSQNPKGTLVSATITKTRSNKWFVSLQYEQHVTVPVFPDTIGKMANPVGLDMGLKDLVITSDGQVFKNEKHAYKAKKKIARLDRSLARKREQAKKDGKELSECRNYQKCKVKRARAHEKIKNQREDLLHKVTTELINNHDFIAVENLSSSNLMKNHNLAFAISDVSWYSFVTKLEYKAEKSGKIIQFIDRFYASTQTCSKCNEKTGPKGLVELSVRQWECSNCNTVHDRDINAAKNVLYKAIEDFLTVGTTG